MNSNKKISRAKYINDYTKRKRQEILSYLGASCVHCGYDKDVRALQVDHVNGGGSGQRKNNKSYHTIIKEIRDGSKDYQILCANCNWIKRFDNLEHLAHIQNPLYMQDIKIEFRNCVVCSKEYIVRRFDQKTCGESACRSSQHYHTARKFKITKKIYE